MYQIKSNEMLNTLIFNIEQTVANAKEKLSISVNNTITETTGRLVNISLKQSGMER